MSVPSGGGERVSGLLHAPRQVPRWRRSRARGYASPTCA